MKRIQGFALDAQRGRSRGRVRVCLHQLVAKRGERLALLLERSLGRRRLRTRFLGRRLGLLDTGVRFLRLALGLNGAAFGLNSAAFGIRRAALGVFRAQPQLLELAPRRDHSASSVPADATASARARSSSPFAPASSSLAVAS